MGARYAGNTRKSIRANTEQRRTVWGMAYSRAPMPCTTVSGYRCGKVPTILRELCGVSITQSAIQQDAMRRNQAGVGEEYRQLRASVKDAKRGVTDDTGWRINGESASMMGFDTDEATVYKSVYVIATRGVRELIPSD